MRNASREVQYRFVHIHLNGVERFARERAVRRHGPSAKGNYKKSGKKKRALPPVGKT